MPAPSVLLVDDGELDLVQTVVARLGLHWVRCLDPDREVALERPNALLLTSGPRSMRMPVLLGEQEPTWVCIYDQDFLPLRDRLRDLGVHYLVSGELEPRAFELFLHQLLHGGTERRALRRIPLRAELEIEVGFERRKAVLLELSRESCVFETATEVPAERRVVVRLPAELTGHESFDLHGRVVRATGAPALAGRGGVISALRFEALDTAAMARIQDLLDGHAPGTQVTPLAPEPHALAADGGLEPGALVHDAGFAPGVGEGDEHRIAPRHAFAGRVDAVRWPGQATPRAALGRDLSLTGVRIAVSPLPAPGAELALALYTGAAREEPLLVTARVVRAVGDEAALHFAALTDDQRQRLERFLAARPRLEQLDAASPALHVAEVQAR